MNLSPMSHETLVRIILFICLSSSEVNNSYNYCKQSIIYKSTKEFIKILVLDYTNSPMHIQNRVYCTPQSIHNINDSLHTAVISM